MEFELYLNTDVDYTSFAERISTVLKSVDSTYSETTFKKTNWGYTMASSYICVDLYEPHDTDPQLKAEWLEELYKQYQVYVNTNIQVSYSGTKVVEGEKMMFLLVGAILREVKGDAILLEDCGRLWLVRRCEAIEVYRCYSYTDFTNLGLKFTEYESD